MSSNKRGIAYLILCALIFCIVVCEWMLYSADISFDGATDSLNKAYFIIGFIGLSLSVLAYGILSYALASQIVLPHVLLFSFLSLSTAILFLVKWAEKPVYNTSFSFEYLLGALPLSGIICGVSLVISVVTMLIVKLWGASKRKMKALH